MGASVQVGCSGWDYKPWTDTFYPADLGNPNRFSYYARHFSTVELNATFYRLPDAETVERWHDRAPAGFLYAVKVARYATHMRKLREPASWITNHLDRVERLGAHLGPNLLQLPPRWHRDVPRLDAALAALPRRHRWAVELRDPSWLHDDVFACLAEHDAALCIHDLLPDHPWERTATDWTYVRFHGPNAVEQPYAGRYTGRRLWRTADRLGAWRDDGCDVYAYFNNDQGAAAPRDAAWLRDRLGE